MPTVRGLCFFLPTITSAFDREIIAPMEMQGAEHQSL